VPRCHPTYSFGFTFVCSSPVIPGCPFSPPSHFVSLTAVANATPQLPWLPAGSRGAGLDAQPDTRTCASGLLPYRPRLLGGRFCALPILALQRRGAPALPLLLTPCAASLELGLAGATASAVSLLPAGHCRVRGANDRGPRPGFRGAPPRVASVSLFGLALPWPSGRRLFELLGPACGHVHCTFRLERYRRLYSVSNHVSRAASGILPELQDCLPAAHWLCGVTALDESSAPRALPFR